MDIFVRMASKHFRDILRACKKQEEMSLQDVADYFETLETMETIKKGDPKKSGPLPVTPGTADGQKPESKSRARRKRKSVQWQSDSSPATQGQKPKPNSPGKRCVLCAEFGGRPETHSSSECRKWRVSHNGRSANERRENKKPRRAETVNAVEELQALQTMVKKLTKKQKSLQRTMDKKRRHVAESSDDSSSDDE